MTARMRIYEPERHFLRVRNFLNETYCAFPYPYNWGMERWNYARYFISPMVGAYGLEEDTQEAGLEAIKMWEDMVRIWEADDGKIAGVTCIEHADLTHPGFGEIFIQRHPDHLDLIDEMLAVGEELYIHPEKRKTFIWAFESDEMLKRTLEERGYIRKEESKNPYLVYSFSDVPQIELPDGYHLQTMADENDIDKRREVFGRGFDHEDPKEWPSAFSYHELQRAPDYRKENDLVIVAPNGDYAACAIVWHDNVNKVGHLEPLSTHPKHRRKGLAKALLCEGIKRLQALGSTWMPMENGGEPFYHAFGFVEKGTQYAWIKQSGSEIAASASHAK